MAAKNCGNATSDSAEAVPATWPRGIAPLARRPVEWGSVFTYVERLRPNQWSRHEFHGWAVLVAFDPAVADLTIWSPGNKERTISIAGGKVVFLPPGWKMAMAWRQSADVIVVTAESGVGIVGSPDAGSHQEVVNLADCYAAVRTMVDVILDLRTFSTTPNGPSDRRVATGGAYLANLLFHAHSLLSCGRYCRNRTFEQVIDRMRAHMQKNAKRRMPVSEIAREVGVSARQLRRVVREETGKSPVEWVREEKAREIRRMLEGGKTLKAAVAEGGFSNISHVHRALKRVYGCTPRAFRRVPET